jgi:hypothetical protein
VHVTGGGEIGSVSRGPATSPNWVLAIATPGEQFFRRGGGCFKISAYDYVTLWRVEVAHGLMLTTSVALCTGNRAFKGPAEQY